MALGFPNISIIFVLIYWLYSPYFSRMMDVHFIRLILLSSPNFNRSLHPTMFCEMSIMIEIVAINEKCTLIYFWSEFVMSYAMKGFVTIVVTLVEVTMEPSRIYLSRNFSWFLLIMGCSENTCISVILSFFYYRDFTFFNVLLGLWIFL